MKRAFFTFIVVALLAVSAGAARAAIILSFDPVIQKTNLGQPVDVDVRISGLGNNAPPSLGAFDLSVTFDDLLLDFAGITFGDPVLGDQLDLFGFGAITGVSEDLDPTVGLLDFFEISLDLPSDLDTLQADSFILATLSFDAVAKGFSLLNFASATLSDSLGNTLFATTSSGSIKVPEPASITLLGLGLVGFGFMLRRPKKAARAGISRLESLDRRV